jgi:hypothetical protein
MNREMPDIKTAIEQSSYDQADAYDNYFESRNEAPERPAQQQRQPDDSGDNGNAPTDYSPLDVESAGFDYEVTEFDGHVWTENDRAGLEDFFSHASRTGMDQRSVDAALGWYVKKLQDFVPPAQQRKANAPQANRGIDARVDEINKIMRQDFRRYQRLGLDKELADLLRRKEGR